MTEPLRPDYATATYKDVELFIPYEQLHLKKRTNHDMVFHLEVHSDELGFLQDSSANSFYVRR